MHMALLQVKNISLLALDLHDCLPALVMVVPQVGLARRLDAVRARLGVWEADDAGVAAHAVEVPAAHAALKHTIL